MTPVFAYGRSGRTYRYYVSAPLQKGASADEDLTLRRVPGQDEENLVVEAVTRLTRLPPSEALQALRRVEVHFSLVSLVFAAGAESEREKLAARLFPGESVSDAPGGWRVTLPVRLKTRGGRTGLARPDGRAASRRAQVDRALVNALSAAHGIAREIGAAGATKGDVREARGAGDACRRAIVPMAFLGPTIQTAIAEGRQPAGLKLEHLLRTDIPLAWADQKLALGF